MSTIDTPDFRPSSPDGGFSWYGLVSALRVRLPLDTSAWAEGVEFLSRTCPSPLNPYSHTCDVGPAKSTPVRVFGGLVEAEPHWFEKAVACSTFPAPRDLDLRAEAERQFEDAFEIAIEEEYCSLLVAEAVPILGTTSILCAYGKAAAAAAGVPGPGRGIIHVDPLVATYLFAHGLVKELSNNRNLLFDLLGNLVVVWRTTCAPNTIFVETNAAVEILLSDYIELPEAMDAVRIANDRVYRLERGFIIARTTCNTFSVAYDCSIPS